jgi:hypothetical protein
VCICACRLVSKAREVEYAGARVVGVGVRGMSLSARAWGGAVKPEGGVEWQLDLLITQWQQGLKRRMPCRQQPVQGNVLVVLF